MSPGLEAAGLAAAGSEEGAAGGLIWGSGGGVAAGRGAAERERRRVARRGRRCGMGVRCRAAAVSYEWNAAFAARVSGPSAQLARFDRHLHLRPLRAGERVVIVQGAGRAGLDPCGARGEPLAEGL